MAESTDIITKRLRITPFSERHLTEDYVAWLNNRDLMRFSEQRHKQHTIDACRSYFRSFEGTPNYFWAIETNDLGHIGNLNAYVDANNGVADMGILIGDQRAHGKGYGLEAWLGGMAFLLSSCGLRKVTAGTTETNIAMIKIARHAGMSEDGIRRQQRLIEGVAINVLHFAVFREELFSVMKNFAWERIVGRELLLEHGQ